MNKYIKKYFPFILLPIILYIITLVNKIYFKENVLTNREYILSNNVESSYETLINNLDETDSVVALQITNSNDKIKKTEIYRQAERLYKNKTNEIVAILNKKLNDDDFLLLELDLDEFDKNIDFALENFDKTIESTVDSDFYKNRYLYEERQKKVRELVETYKGFLK